MLLDGTCLQNEATLNSGNDRLWVRFEANTPCSRQGIKVLEGIECGRPREENSHPLLRWIHQAKELKCREEGGVYDSAQCSQFF
ncbi:hypothetical protein IEQ34_010225 [Dendrobium chrysotoxum]|uniref:Uncharacterized protein n=1 Tax=Dendrobium chrysotoxum TaxID=161865 RepID=A0AAV7H564_DENCH|nr:hypothetical protein IEQ34_010225 [Dendrobium chrysotoxum]